MSDIERSGFHEGFVESEGGRIRYARAGQGPALVHLQLGGLRLTPAHAMLARRFRVVVLETATPTSGMPALASTMRRAIDALGGETFNLLGTSFGARAALWLALEARDRVLSLVLEAPAAIRPDGAVLPAGLPDGIAGPARDRDLEARLPGLTTAALVLFGTRDAVIPPAAGSVYKALMPGCHLVFVYDAGHDIATDRPEAFTEVAVDFFERHEAFLVSRARTAIFP